MKKKMIAGVRPLASMALAFSGVNFTNASAQSSESTIKAYTTGYSYYDNTPAGSTVISNPILHKKTGGTGTFAHPITVAVEHSIIKGQGIYRL